MNRRKNLALILILAALCLPISVQSPMAFSFPDRQVNPVPYYSQGSRPWCAVAAAAMIIAYVRYPEQAPTLESLAREMGTTMEGTGLGEFLGAMYCRGIETETMLSYSSQRVRYSSAYGYPILVVTKIERMTRIEVYKDVWVDVRVIYTHAMLIVGYDRGKMFIHDPATSPLGELSDAQLEKDWAYGYIIKAKPKEIPGSKLKVNFVNAAFPVKLSLDGELKNCTEFWFEVGTSHEIKVTPIVVRHENRTHRVTYACDRDAPITLTQWTTGSYVLNFTYTKTVEYRVKIRHPTNPQDLWVEDRGSVWVPKVDRYLPADGVLALLGYRKVFRGWYRDDQIMDIGLGDRAVTVTGPLELEPQWGLEITERTIVIIGMACAAAILLAVVGDYVRGLARRDFLAKHNQRFVSFPLGPAASNLKLDLVH